MASIRDYVFSQPLFSTHDHLRGFTAWDDELPRLTYRNLLCYATGDLTIAGGTLIPDSDFSRLWPLVRTTGYGQAVVFACRKIVGQELTGENDAEITNKLKDFVRGKTASQVYGEMYRLANVGWDINDTWWQEKISHAILSGREHPSEVRQALRCNNDELFILSTKEDIAVYEKEYRCSIGRLADLERMIQEYIQEAKGLGRLVALKSAVAYLRPLDFKPVTRMEAEASLEAILMGREAPLRPLHDYLFRFYVEQGRVFDLPVQIHTGYLARIGEDIRHGDPAALIPLLQEFRDVRFDLFHAGWPFSSIMAAIGKQFPNVWLDLCWAWAMNPQRAAQTLGEWLDAVPQNKVFAFGADADNPLTLPGYAEQARRGIASVLEQKIAAGEYDQRTAEEVARRIMFQNARDFFGM